MSTQLLLTGLLIADVILCFVIIVLIIIINREVKKRRNGIDENSLREFKKLLDDSQASTNYLLEAMNESRKSLKEIAYVLAEKEGRLRALIEESQIACDKLKVSAPNIDNDLIDRKYEDVITLVRQGLAKKEISQRLDVTEGEIDLIIDLDTTRHRT